MSQTQPQIPSILKSPQADLDYGFDLSAPTTPLKYPWLQPGEQVVSLTVTADAGITVNSSGIETNDTGVEGALLIAWLSGGAVGTNYNVSFLFTTNSSPPRTDVRSLVIQCVNR
jgi:hypothetical protein